MPLYISAVETMTVGATGEGGTTTGGPTGGGGDHEAFLSLGCALICWQSLRQTWRTA